MWHKAWFGETPCAVHLRQEGAFVVTTPYKLKAHDPGERKNLGVEVIGQSEEEALGRARDYLIRRYGTPGSLISVSQDP